MAIVAVAYQKSMKYNFYPQVKVLVLGGKQYK
jgi:hypothetical protein